MDIAKENIIFDSTTLKVHRVEISCRVSVFDSSQLNTPSPPFFNDNGGVYRSVFSFAKKNINLYRAMGSSLQMHQFNCSKLECLCPMYISP